MSYSVLVAGSCPDSVIQSLQGAAYRVATAPSASTAAFLASSNPFDLFIVDGALPDGQGLQLCRELRRAHFDIPILMVTPRYEAGANIAALTMGADDCVAHCFDVREIVARIEALLRRTARCRAAALSIYEFGDVCVDFVKSAVRRHGQWTSVPRKELELLRYLVARRGEVVSRRELLYEVWGYHSTATRTLDVHMAYLRQKLEADPKSPKHILTIRGEGYVFRGDVNQFLPSSGETGETRTPRMHLVK